MFGSKRTLGSGTHSISVPMQTGGIFLCKVTIGHESYSFKASSFGASSTGQAVVSSGTSTLARQAKVTARISDVIAATSPGMLNYRCVIGNSDTSGVVIKMLANAGDVTDVDGNVYQSVQIGNQVWTVENYRATKYNDGTAIPTDTSAVTWGNWEGLAFARDTTPKYCFYNNTANADSIKKYGALYNWYVVSPTNIKKIAPAGWHVPSDAEWDTLQNYLFEKGRIDHTLLAKTDWQCVDSDLSKNNSSGFSALPSGFRDQDGHFYCQGYGAGSFSNWWSAMENSAGSAYARSLGSCSEYLDGIRKQGGYSSKKYGFSVRLLRD